MARFRVVPLSPKSVIKKFRLCPTVCDEMYIDSTFDYYHKNFGITKCDFIPFD